MNRRLKITLVFVWIPMAMIMVGPLGQRIARADGNGAIPLITGVSANGQDSQPDHGAAVFRRRVVEVDATALTGSAVPQELELQLFEDIQYCARLLWTESSPEGGLAWIGRLTDQPNSRITLVARGDRVSATIRVQKWRYDLRPLENGLHVVQQIKNHTSPAGESLTGGIVRTMATAAAVEGAIAISQLMVDEELRVLAMVNEERSKVNGLSPLASDDRLTAAARGHSQDMSDQDYFSHTSLDGRSPADRITEAGYDPNGIWGENIAYGYTTPELVMNAWMTSSGHRANILSDRFCDLGVGYAAAGHYWTQDFGRRSGVADCTAANHNPSAAFTAQPTSGVAPLRVDLDAGASDDPDGDALSFSWDLGDGRSATTAVLVHTYAIPGLYTVRLTVDDGQGGSNTTQRQITVQSDTNTAPQARDDIYFCDQSRGLSVSAPGVLGNDEDEQNPAALSAILITAPAQGTLLLNADGAFEYQSPPDFSGEEQFTYKASDGQFQSETATVTISVQSDGGSAAPGDDGGNDGGGGGGCFIETLPGRHPTRQ